MIKVLKPGLSTSVQDLGRFGYRNIGVPVSGAMDSISANLANALLNNQINSAVLEITMLGPQLQFFTSTNIAITGAEMSPKLNSVTVKNNKVISVKKGDILSFGVLKKGLRSYLAVKGGILTENVLNSRCYYRSLTKNEHIQEGTILHIQNNCSNVKTSLGALHQQKHFYDTDCLNVFEGPDLELFTGDEKKQLLSTNYTISNQINRMGYRLLTKVVPHTKSILTSPVLPGTVQLMPLGNPIILMKDAQTTGGYPRIFQLTEKSIAILAQKKPGEIIKFQLQPKF